MVFHTSRVRSSLFLQAAALCKNHQPPVTPHHVVRCFRPPCVMYPINHTQGPEKDLPRKPDICIKFSGEPVLVGGGMCTESPPPPIHSSGQ
jgi:hypothetical protein